MSDIFGITDIETIERLADIVNSRELSEITIADGDKTITVKGRKCPPPPPPQPFFGAAPPVNMPLPVQPSAEPAPVSAPEESGGNIVKSPIVGTFYQSPAPDKPPFVKVGDKVKKGDVIMIIESMKLMNEIQSEYDGVVDRILVTDGQAVEFDEPIMIIK
ncbi:MAG: acetyl-CoA carboxylase biotin carboxyl carrier protein [Ruminococcus sp.]|nr:acetyl-CoA carboxylase biotin carboxyl carrier protein [Ruminococcus sp.]MBR2282943.1 acetyl-CoA carboxylase biotin carboxyl carrier protein [Ruminococcus sp.]